MTDGSIWTDSDLARLRLEGLDHLNRLKSGEATDHDAAAFINWRGTSRAHEEAFRAAVRLQRLVVVAETQVADSHPFPNVVPFRAKPVLHLSRRGFLGGALAASAVGGIFLAGRSLNRIPSPAEMVADYRTGPGERRFVKLAGGATAELNTRTSVDIRHDLEMPAIELINGEAIMASGASPRAALVAGTGTVVVRDGRVNARRDGNIVCITCLGGAVEVAWADQKRMLQKADEVRYDDNGIGPVKPGTDPAVLTAWQSGTLIFQNMPMRDVVAEINRYRAGKVYLANSRLEKRPLSGTYYVNRLDDFFSQAQLAFNIKVTRLPGDIVIMS